MTHRIELIDATVRGSDGLQPCRGASGLQAGVEDACNAAIQADHRVQVRFVLMEQITNKAELSPRDSRIVGSGQPLGLTATTGQSAASRIT